MNKQLKVWMIVLTIVVSLSFLVNMAGVWYEWTSPYVILDNGNAYLCQRVIQLPPYDGVRINGYCVPLNG